MGKFLPGFKVGLSFLQLSVSHAGEQGLFLPRPFARSGGSSGDTNLPGEKKESLGKESASPLQGEGVRASVPRRVAVHCGKQELTPAGPQCPVSCRRLQGLAVPNMAGR